MSRAPHELERIDLTQLIAQRDRFERLLGQSPGVDPFCSAIDWITSFREAFLPGAEPVIFTGAPGFVALMSIGGARGHTLASMEVGWGLACPLVGPDPDTLLAALFEALRRQRVPWKLLVLSGLEVGGAAVKAVARQVGGRLPVRLGDTVGRRITPLTPGGFESWLARRGRRFRANLRRAIRGAARAGVEYEYRRVFADDRAVDAAYERILAVERSSWKGQSGVGIHTGPARAFYRLLARRLARRSALRCLFLRLDGADIAYLLGGFLGADFRGLQLSFADAHRGLQPGNLAQAELIHRLCETEPQIARYDLGTDMPYKRRWAEAGLETTTCLVFSPASR